MFEFEQYKKTQRKSSSESSLRKPGNLDFKKPVSFSLVNWGEHCVDCAFPGCYQTCDLYEDRGDGRCRRFKFGIYKDKEAKGWLRYSGFMQFKHASYLWSQGNATQFPRFLTKSVLAFHDATVRVLTPVDNFIKRITGKTYLLLAFQAVRRRIILYSGRLYRFFPKPDSFQLELYNPSQEVYKMSVILRNSYQNGHYENGGNIKPGLNIIKYPVSDIEQCINLAKPFQLSFHLSQPENKYLYMYSATFIREKQKKIQSEVPSNDAKKVKCLVWDLDNTLWEGVLLEKGKDNIQLHDGIRAIIKELDKRGILLSIASKNNQDDAKQALEALGLWDYFLVPQISWDPKSEGIKKIAQELNIGIDTLAFIDDNDFELDEVKANCPSVRCFHADAYLNLSGLTEFEGGGSSDSAQRRKLYQTEMIRKKDLAGQNNNIEDFLKSCNIKVFIKTPEDSQIERIHELAQRTNQLNFSGVRYKKEDIISIVSDSKLKSYVINCEDKYGDYGIVGFCIVDESKDIVSVRDLMLSCRVQGKKVEHSILLHIALEYFALGHEIIHARYNRTKRNSPAGKVFDDLNFKLINQEDSVELLELKKNPEIKPIPYITIINQMIKKEQRITPRVKVTETD